MKKTTRNSLQCLGGTMEMTLMTKPFEKQIWWVDNSYAVHPDMKSGIYMTLSKVAMYIASCKQKLNTKSSAEAELVAIHIAMAQVLCSKNFLATHGHYIPMTRIYQDNKSTILLAENSKTSSSQRLRHF